MLMDDYKETACRMHLDSELLFNAKRWFNTCYLSGYVVECYCKLILEMNPDDNGRRHSHKLDEMQKILHNYALGQNAYSSYCVDVASICPNIINNWSTGLRYGDDTCIFNSEDMARKFYQEQKEVMLQIKKMMVDGVI